VVLLAITAALMLASGALFVAMDMSAPLGFIFIGSGAVSAFVVILLRREQQPLK
jgi:hypothetical protein